MLLEGEPFRATDESAQKIMDGYLRDLGCAKTPNDQWPLALAGSLLFALGGLLFWSLASSESPGPRPVTRFSIRLPPGSSISPRGRHALAMSPDGTHVVYTADDQLYLRAMDREEPSPIRGTDGARGPFFSPDGLWVGFWADGQLKKVTIDGGAPVALCQVGNPRGASWEAEDTIVFAQSGGGILRVSANGGTPEVLVPLEDSHDLLSFGPQLLPGGKAVLFSLLPSRAQTAQIVVQSLETGERRVLIQEGTYGRYVPTGHLVYGLESTLFAVPFDVDRLEITGGPVPLVEDIWISPSPLGGVTQFAFSGTGALAYLPRETREGLALVWVDREGNATPMAEPRRPYQRPRLSPDGQRLAIEIGAGAADVWLLELDREVLTRLTFEGGRRPIWTPDGSRIAFASTRAGGDYDIFWRPSDGSGVAEQLTEGAYRVPDSFSADGKTLVFRERAETGRDIGVLSLDGDRETAILLGTSFDELHASVSPDGQWVAYTSDESGERQIYVQSFPELGGKKQISADGGDEPVWSRDGTELFYRNGDQMLAVAIAAEPVLTPSRPVLLFEGSYERMGGGVSANYDVARDGRFVMLRREEESAVTEQRIHVVLNWFEELKERVPSN